MAKICLKQLIFFLLALYSATDAIRLGSCPKNIRPKEDTNTTELIGRWYEHSKYALISNVLQRCTYYDIDQTQEDNLLSVSVTSTGQHTGIQTGASGEVAVTGPGTFRFQGDGLNGLFGGSDFSILDTDYENFAVFYACEELLGLGITHNRYAWILTRSQQPDFDSIQQAHLALLNNGLSIRDLQLTSQFNCPGTN